jgi:3-dehydroquinate synthase
MTHGEAISVGMIIATQIAIELKICSADFLNRLKSVISRAGLPTSAKNLGIKLDDVLAYMKHDKKFADGNNRFVLPTGIGSWKEFKGVDEKLIRDLVVACLGSEK